MPKTFPIKNDFTRGIFSKILHDKTNESIYASGCKDLFNCFPVPQGGVTRRGGTHLAGFLNDLSDDINLIPFIFSDDPLQSNILIFENKLIRFLNGYTKELITDSRYDDPNYSYSFAGVGSNHVTVTGTYTESIHKAFTIEYLGKTGEENTVDSYIITELGSDNQVYFYVNGETEFPHIINYYYGLIISPTQYDVNTVGDKWTFECGKPYQLKSPYSTTDVYNIDYAQKQDVVLMVNHDYYPRKLSRLDYDDWELSMYSPNQAPWSPHVGLTYKLYDVYGINKAYNNVVANTSANLAMFFSEVHGAEVILSGTLERQIAISLDNDYYMLSTDTFRQELSSAAIATAAKHNNQPTDVSLEIKGNIYLPEDGVYEFALNAGRQGAEVQIDNKVVCDLYVGSGGTNLLDPNGLTFQTLLAANKGIATLTAGEHAICVRGWIQSQARTLALYWKKPGDTTFTLIPTQYFVEQSERYGVTASTYNHYLIADTVTLPPTTQEQFDALFKTSTTGITLNKTGLYEDTISFHSQVGSLLSPFTADVPPEYIDDGTRHSWECFGTIEIPADGTYSFAVDGNDGMEFIIYENSPDSPLAKVTWLSNTNTQTQTDGYDYFKSSAFERHKSSVAVLTAGLYKFRARYWNQSIGFAFAVAWKTPGSGFYEIIPRSAFSPNPGYYPGSITCHKQRVCVDGGTMDSQSIHCSETLNPENFERGENDDDGIKFQIASNQVDSIKWLRSNGNLIIGTQSTEYIAKGDFVGVGDIIVEPNTHYGSLNIPPVISDDALYFVEKSGLGLLEFTYQFERDKNVGINIDLLADDLFTKGIKKLCVQTGNNAAFSFSPEDDEYKPYSMNLVWVLTQDGKLACLTRESLEKVIAWSRHELAGTNAEVLSFACIPDTNGDRLYFAVSRTINGQTVKTIEYLDPELLNDLGSITEHATKVTEIILSHLPYANIKISGINSSGDWIRVYENEYPDDFVIRLDASGDYVFDKEAPICTRMYAGLHFDSIIETLQFDPQFSVGSTIGMRKKWIKACLSVINSGNYSIANAAYPEDEEISQETGLFTGVENFHVPGWNEEAALRISQSYPLPLTVRSLFGELQINA